MIEEILNHGQVMTAFVGMIGKGLPQNVSADGILDPYCSCCTVEDAVGLFFSDSLGTLPIGKKHGRSIKVLIDGFSC